MHQVRPEHDVDLSQIVREKVRKEQYKLEYSVFQRLQKFPEKMNCDHPNWLMNKADLRFPFALIQLSGLVWETAKGVFSSQ